MQRTKNDEDVVMKCKISFLSSSRAATVDARSVLYAKPHQRKGHKGDAYALRYQLCINI